MKLLVAASGRHADAKSHQPEIVLCRVHSVPSAFPVAQYFALGLLKPSDYARLVVIVAACLRTYTPAMTSTLNLARASFRLFPRPVFFPRRQIHSTPMAFAKKKRPKTVVQDLFDDEEQWGVTEDLIPSAPQPSLSKPDAVLAPTSPTPRATKKDVGRLSPGERLDKYTTLVRFVKPRIGRNPTKKTPLVRRTVFPQLIQLSTTAEHLQTITDLMVTWKEGRLGTQGKARFGPDGKPKGGDPFSESTSELFARRCEELGVPEHALMVYGEFNKYALPLTIPAARRLLHGLLAKDRPFAEIITATALYTSHGLPPVQQDLPSCALLLSACLRNLKTAEGKEAIETQSLIDALVPSLKKQLKKTMPMPESRDVRDKTIRLWLKSIMLDFNGTIADQTNGQILTWGHLKTWRPPVNSNLTLTATMKEEDIAGDSAPTDSSLTQFRSSVAQYSYDSPPSNTEPLRRSPRKHVPSRSTSSSSVKRLASESVDMKETKISPKKQKRSYAPPETYAHLRELQDHLKPDLDVMFCGINPGKKSAEIGHHFGNPSNHFWWCLHQSGFTDTKLLPEEDYTLPDSLGLGLTNLVDRPTSEEAELSAAEQLASVPGFLAKVARFRPGIVCFVGLKIAKVLDKSLKVTLSSDAKSWGLRPYKMVHQVPSKFSETLFFAAPSTSGLVTQFQRPKKAEIFGEVRQLVQDLKAGTVCTKDMTVIQPHQIAQVAQAKIEDPFDSRELLSFPKVEEEKQLGGLIQMPPHEGQS
ncbi:UDG domain-containing protein [Mycena sanguinolenta]|uniref:UDG domain-containing protein n=1 Tax=Mycena sanguinolenta TaxID=230812 RepID=A0A8H6YSI2_9AGAR|nr:UDG domain-containing protein [Mycena sanguinolenta]